MTAYQSSAQPSRPPSLAWTIAEPYRAVTERCFSEMIGLFANKPLQGDGHSVLVLPGFTADDKMTVTLRMYLRRYGYDAHGWELGQNLGSRSIGFDGNRLLSRVKAIAQGSGRSVSIIGWSLGGLMAREIARANPRLIRQVIMLGSPLMGDPRNTKGWQLYDLLTGETVSSDDAQMKMEVLRGPLTVPSASIYSRTDGIVSWRNCIQPASDRSENIEVNSSHWGLPANSEVLEIISNRLGQTEGMWASYQSEHKRELA